MVLPNFLVIGAPKSGTTSLYKYLDEHPQVYMSSHKEPRFFAFEGSTGFNGHGVSRYNIVTTLDEYQQLFSQVSDQQAIGEASTWYLSSPTAPERIKHYIPDVKLIAILREPAERAYSHYWHLYRKDLEPIDTFEKAILAEEHRKQSNWLPDWYYLQEGFYYEHLTRYFQLFGREQLRVYLYEDLCSDPTKVLRDIFQFLDIDSEFEPNVVQRYNVTKLMRSKRLGDFLSRPSTIKRFIRRTIPQTGRAKAKQMLVSMNTYDRPKMLPEIKASLLADYSESIYKLQELLNRDLSHWLAV